MAAEASVDPALQHLWPRRLPRELSEYIVALVDPQDVTCNLRLSCKEAAYILCNTDARKTASLSEAVTVHLFAPCWGTPTAVHRLPVARRKRLLALTAGTSVLDNVKLLVEDAGLPASAESMAAAAAAGNLPVCQLLHGYGCPWRDPPGAEQPDIFDNMTELLHTIRYSEDSAQGYPAMRAAAEGGHLELCRWLHGAGCPATPAQILRWAARGGHRAIVEWVLSLGFSWQPQQQQQQQQAAGPAQAPADDSNQHTASAGFQEAVLGGHRQLCEFMLQRGCKYLPIGPAVALAGGHKDLYDWLMQLHAENPETCHVEWQSLPGAAALGADLATLQREVARADERMGPTWRTERMGTLVGMQAACSETPDAAAKLRWLYYTAGALQPNFNHMCVMGKVGRPDMVEALVEILGREEARECEEARGAAAAAAAVLPQGQEQGGAGQQQQQQLVTDVVRNYQFMYHRFGLMAAASGHVGALEVLERVDGWRPAVAQAAMAAYGGNAGAIVWAMERVGPSVANSGAMVVLAAESGNTPLVRKLAESGYALSAEVLNAAARTGNGELVEWLVQRGCPQGVSVRGGERGPAICVTALGPGSGSAGCEWKRAIWVVGEATWAGARCSRV